MSNMLTRPFYLRLGVLYLGGSVVYYLTTWYAYGGFADQGHPPIYDLEEFCASGGLKFTTFFLTSLLLLPIYQATTQVPNVLRLPILAAGFILVSGYAEQKGLEYFGWVNIFGGRSIIFSYLLTGVFFVIQWLYLQANISPKPAPVTLSSVIPDPNNEPLPVTKAGSHYALKGKEILYVEAFGNYTKVYTAEETFIYGKGIGKLCSERSDLPLLRIHRKHAVMKTRLQRIRKTGRHTEVVLEGDIILKVGEAYRKKIATAAN